MSHLTQLGKFLLVSLLNFIMELNTTMGLEEDFIVIASPPTPGGGLYSLGPWAALVRSHPWHLADRQVGHVLLPAYHSLARGFVVAQHEGSLLPFELFLFCSF